jgi:NAD(P)-dependent dehydrogenase (short-subunit alcohol dehydrogenase family)
MRLAELLVDHIAASLNGRIVTLSSMLGSMTLNRIGGLYAYRASKAAVNAIMKSMAIDLGRKGIIAAA